VTVILRLYPKECWPTESFIDPDRVFRLLKGLFGGRLIQNHLRVTVILFVFMCLMVTVILGHALMQACAVDGSFLRFYKGLFGGRFPAIRKTSLLFYGSQIEVTSAVPGGR
jgi:hypothetical protein